MEFGRLLIGPAGFRVGEQNVFNAVVVQAGVVAGAAIAEDAFQGQGVRQVPVGGQRPAVRLIADLGHIDNVAILIDIKTAVVIVRVVRHVAVAGAQLVQQS